MDNVTNVYYRARREAAEHDKRLSSRERASELLGCSVSTLANYELEVTKTVPPDAVVMMADLYNAPELKSHYCANECPIGRGMPIPTTISSIELITCRVIKALSQSAVESIKQQLIDISADGKVTKDKLPTVMSLMTYLDNLSHTLGELRLSCQKALSAGGVNVKG
jgi:hypothetical protein